MKYLIIGLLFSFTIQCAENQSLQNNIVENLKSLIFQSTNYNLSLSSLLSVCFFGGGIYAITHNQSVTPWILATMSHMGIITLQLIFIIKTMNRIDPSSV